MLIQKRPGVMLRKFVNDGEFRYEWNADQWIPIVIGKMDEIKGRRGQKRGTLNKWRWLGMLKMWCYQ